MEPHDETILGTEFYGSEKPAVTEFAPGTRFDDYELVERLGRGGMGEVWRALDIPGEREVAIKFVPKEMENAEAEMDRVREMFRQVHGLQHEHICPLYAMKHTPGFGTYIVMKFIRGMTLAKYAREVRQKMGAFPVAALVEILKPIAAALDYAHRKKVIHRDIKPGNIMVCVEESPETGRPGKITDVQLIDFGLAAAFRASMSRVSQQKLNTSGTRPYMAPEQWRGQFQDAATDQYALGVTVYELLAGILPFDSDDVEALRLCVLSDTPLAIPGQPAEVNAAIQRALAKERKARFASCMDFVSALEGKRVLGAYVPDAETRNPESETLLSEMLAGRVGQVVTEVRKAAKTVDQKWGKMLSSAEERQKAFSGARQNLERTYHVLRNAASVILIVVGGFFLLMFLLVMTDGGRISVSLFSILLPILTGTVIVLVMGKIRKTPEEMPETPASDMSSSETVEKKPKRRGKVFLIVGFVGMAFGFFVMISVGISRRAYRQEVYWAPPQPYHAHNHEGGFSCESPFSETPQQREENMTEEAKYLVGETMIKEVDGVQYVFRWCPPGEFTMGSPEDEEGRGGNEPQHQVILTRGFWMLETEVTQLMWERMMGQNPSSVQGQTLPVSQVSWHQCLDFCRVLTNKMNARVLLPTEAQWEYACRAGTTGAFAAEDYKKISWCEGGGGGKPQPVKRKEPNDWGLYDMHGNVAEWCLDVYAPLSFRTETDPLAESGGGNAGQRLIILNGNNVPVRTTEDIRRVYRGGSAQKPRNECRSAFRSAADAHEMHESRGFRIVLGPGTPGM